MIGAVQYIKLIEVAAADPENTDPKRMVVVVVVESADSSSNRGTGNRRAKEGFVLG